MKVSEALQVQLWSKKTSQKIGLIAGIAFVLLLLGFGIWNEVQTHWITPGERAGAKAGLTEIDALQDAKSLDGEHYELIKKRAEAALKIAEERAVTYRDTALEMKLGGYLISVEAEHYRPQLRSGSASRALETMGAYGLDLHKALD